ncbi:hypothetical protein FACS18949_06980 [Clostridia bacterium]|nr:hypothetical protein FACS189425_05450 [Clostridia bacterium]GHV33327.1 hypothetical protein FACS18949_06980 [Clostridia bacterium]
MNRIKILAVAVCLLIALSACGGGLNGTYTTNETLISSSVTFNGDKITMSALGLNFTGTYKVKGGEIIVTTNILGNESEQTMSFKHKGKSVFIDGTEYIKQK